MEVGGNYPDLLAKFLLKQPCVHFALFAMSTHCWLTFSSMSVTTPDPLQQGCYSASHFPLGSPAWCRTVHLLNPRRFSRFSKVWFLQPLPASHPNLGSFARMQFWLIIQVVEEDITQYKPHSGPWDIFDEEVAIMQSP